jgi:hypothetical protein
MAIHLTISHDERLVIAIVEEVAPADFERYFAELTAAGAMTYRKIIDLTASQIAMQGADVRAMSQRISDYARTGALGAIAIVVSNELAEVVSATYEQRVKADRPFRMVRTLAEARRWLEEVDPAARG